MLLSDSVSDCFVFIHHDRPGCVVYSTLLLMVVTLGLIDTGQCRCPTLELLQHQKAVATAVHSEPITKRLMRSLRAVHSTVAECRTGSFGCPVAAANVAWPGESSGQRLLGG